MINTNDISDIEKALLKVCQVLKLKLSFSYISGVFYFKNNKTYEEWSIEADNYDTRPDLFRAILKELPSE